MSERARLTHELRGLAQSALASDAVVLDGELVQLRLPDPEPRAHDLADARVFVLCARSRSGAVR